MANGIFYPTKDNDRDKSFIIPEKVSLLGGSKAILFNSNITGNIAKILGSALYQDSYNDNIKDGSNIWF